MKVFNVAEKPSVAKEISNILSGNKARRVKVQLLSKHDIMRFI
jgi:DNA topoisomerase IA